MRTGTTGARIRAASIPTPGWKGSIRPVSQRRPSGKISTDEPCPSRVPMSRNASRAPASRCGSGTTSKQRTPR